HGRRGISRLFLGSVAEAVLRKSSRPILFTRPEFEPPKRPLRRILVPLDNRGFSTCAVELVKALALESGAELILLQTVVPVFVPQAVAGGLPMIPLAEPPEPAPRLEKLARGFR